MPRFNWFGLRKKSASEQRAQQTQKSLNGLYTLYKIPQETPIKEARQRLEQISDPSKRRIALLNFERIVRQH